MCATLCRMESSEKKKHARSIVKRGVAFAIVAVVAFGIGLSFNTGSSASAIISHIPLVGDGLGCDTGPKR